MDYYNYFLRSCSYCFDEVVAIVPRVEVEAVACCAFDLEVVRNE